MVGNTRQTYSGGVKSAQFQNGKVDLASIKQKARTNLEQNGHLWPHGPSLAPASSTGLWCRGHLRSTRYRPTQSHHLPGASAPSHRYLAMVSVKASRDVTCQYTIVINSLIKRRITVQLKTGVRMFNPLWHLSLIHS